MAAAAAVLTTVAQLRVDPSIIETAATTSGGRNLDRPQFVSLPLSS
jgi:hypothetical protein